MKVLAVIVTPPVTHESGGLSAGLNLSGAAAELADVEAAVMSDRTSHESRGRLVIHRFRCVSAAGPFASLLPRQMRSLLWRSTELACFIRQQVPDLVHIHNPHPAGALWQVCMTCRDLGIPYVISGHGFVEMSAFSASLGVALWKRPFVGALVTRPFLRAVWDATHVFLTSPFEGPIVSAMGIPANRQSLVTNGVSPFYLQAADAELCLVLAARWGLDRRVPSFLFVGNHTVNKGIDVLLEAVHRVRVPVRVLIAGRIRSRGEHESLCKRHRANELADRVVFTDAVTDEELRALYQTVDVFVFPSRADTMPLVVLEAMASGLPVIATRVGGISYQLAEEAGLLIPPGDPEALARAMTDLAGNAPGRLRMGAAGHRRVHECFDWNRSAGVAVEIYRKILESRSGVSVGLQFQMLMKGRTA